MKTCRTASLLAFGALFGLGAMSASPPDTKHEWRPDPGSTLRAVQIYTPRGPEQRFVALAAAETDAGAPAAAAPRKR